MSMRQFKPNDIVYFIGTDTEEAHLSRIVDVFNEFPMQVRLDTIGVQDMNTIRHFQTYREITKGNYAERYYESDIADAVYDTLFSNSCDIDFLTQFPDAEVNREFAYINLNDEFFIKIERI